MTLQQYLQSIGMPDGILDPKWRSLSDQSKLEIKRAWQKASQE